MSNTTSTDRARIGGADTGGILLDSVALTAFPARIAAKPLTFLDGALDFRDAPAAGRSTGSGISASC